MTLRIDPTLGIDPIVTVLREQRVGAGYSVRHLAALSGLNSSSISEWENGHHEPTLTNLRTWCKALGLDLAVVVKP